MSKLYIEKVTTLKAIQWTGDNTDEVLKFCKPLPFTVKKITKQYIQIAIKVTMTEASVKGYSEHYDVRAVNIDDYLVVGNLEVDNGLSIFPQNEFEERYQECQQT